MKGIGVIFLVLIVSVGVSAQDKASSKDYGVVDLAELAVNPIEYDGKMVEISGEVVSINADHKLMEVFNARTKVLIVVNLDKLTEMQRRSLIKDPVHRVSVFGRLEMKGGRPVIKADNVLPLAATLIAGSK